MAIKAPVSWPKIRRSETSRSPPEQRHSNSGAIVNVFILTFGQIANAHFKSGFGRGFRL
jgi:hypothetical protein